MSVIVKGMEMPKGCIDPDTSNVCPLVLHCPAVKAAIAPAVGKRLKDCPLAEVPTPHGRLIDADALDFGKVFIGASDFATDCREGAKNLVSAAPTIIKAEGERSQ